MKGFTAAAFLVLGFVATSTFAQSSRPRVAPTPTPPTIKNNPIPSTQTNRPPTLGGPSKQQTPQAPVTAPKSDDSDEVVKVQTNLVTMPVSVLDRDGRFISGLQRQDFQIFENGAQQKLEYFQSVETPFTVILLIDTSPSTQWQIENIQDAAVAFVDQLRVNDRVVVISFDEHVHVLSRPTNDRNELRRAIRQSRFGDGTSLYEAVDHVLNQQLKQIQGRKAVVLFTDGVDTTSRHASYQSTVKDVEESDAMFYTIRYDTSRDMNNGGWGGGFPPYGQRGGWGGAIGIILGGQTYPGGRRGGRGGGNEYETGRRYLETLAQNSGGREFEADSLQNLDTAFSGIAEELRRQYSIGYYPETIGKLGDRKQIKIRVMRPNVVVRAKTTYIVGQTDRTLATK